MAKRPPQNLSSSDERTIWFEGDVLACACSQCGAPMSIRTLLMLADCWRCGCEIELSEEARAAVSALSAEPPRPTDREDPNALHIPKAGELAEKAQK